MSEPQIEEENNSNNSRFLSQNMLNSVDIVVSYINSDLLPLLINEDDELVLECIAKRDDLDENLKYVLAESVYDSVRAQLALNQTCNSELLNKLYNENQKTYKVRKNISMNINVTTELLEKLGRDKNQKVCAAVAENIHTPSHIIDELILHPRKSVRESVLRNEELLNEKLHKFVNDKSDDIRYALASDESGRVEVSTLEILSKDSESVIRAAVAKNKQTPIDIVKEMKNDESEMVIDTVNERLVGLSNPVRPF